MRQFLLGTICCAALSLAVAQEKTLDLSYESPVLVRKGPVEITLADFVAYMDRRVPQDDQRALLASATRVEGVLENIVLTEGFWVRAQERGMMDDPYFRARLYQAAAREARNAYREQLQQEIELESYESQAREMYLVEPERFSRTKTVNMEHLLVAVNEEQGEIEAMKRVIQAHERLMGGEAFVDVASDLSDDPTFPENQGLLEDLEVSSLVPSVAAAVDALSIGEYSLPVQSRFGWHIIRLEEIQDAGKMTWEEAQPLAEQLARNQHLTESWERVLREINSAPMQFAPDAVRAILSHYGVDGFGIPGLGEDTKSDASEQ